MGKVIAFANNKGGVGKTTSATAVGLAWAKMDKRVLFVDLDSQANLTSIISGKDAMEQKWDRTIEDAFIEGPEGQGLPIEHTDNPNVDYVPTDLDLSNFERDTARAAFQKLLLVDLIKPIKDEYDFIVIDCPPSLSNITYNALIASDYLCLVSNPEGSSYRGLEMMVNFYNEIVSNARYNPDLALIGVIVTRNEKDKIAKMHADMFAQDFGQYMIEPYVPKSTKVSQASSFSRSIFDIEPNGKVAQAYLKVSQEILMRINDEQKERAK